LVRLGQGIELTTDYEADALTIRQQGKINQQFETGNRKMASMTGCRL